MTGFFIRRLKLAAWLLFAIFFLVYMLNIDRVLYAVNGKSYVVKLPPSFSVLARGDLKMQWLANYPPVNNRFEEGKGMRIFIPNFANTMGVAKVRLFFKSAEALYEVMANRQAFLADPQKGVVDFFASTSALEAGIYTIGLYVSDDNGERFAWMNTFFEKVPGGPVEYISRPVAVAPSIASKGLQFAIDGISMVDRDDNKFVRLSGWIVLENADMDDYCAYITLRDAENATKTFYAPLYTRRDIASLYDDSHAANSGFQITVPHDELTPGKHRITVMVKSRKTGEILESLQSETENF